MRTIQEIVDFQTKLGWGAGMDPAMRWFKPTNTLYATPRKGWLLGPGLAAFKHNLKVLGMDDYVPDENDCDSFTLQFISFARIDHHRTQRAMRQVSPNLPLCGVAIGFLFYLPDVNGVGPQHAIGFSFEEGKDGLEATYIETVPQYGIQERVLSDWEVKSINFSLV